MLVTHPYWLTSPDPAGPVTCYACGCRLQPADGSDGQSWRHFSSMIPGRDARGDRPPCADAEHDRRGHPVEATFATA